VIEKEEKRKYENQRTFYMNLHLKDGIGVEFRACFEHVCSPRWWFDVEINTLSLKAVQYSDNNEKD